MKHTKHYLHDLIRQLNDVESFVIDGEQDFFTIDLAIVWDAVRRQSELRQAVESLLEMTSDDEG